jgi:hypothetical protein
MIRANRAIAQKSRKMATRLGLRKDGTAVATQVLRQGAGFALGKRQLTHGPSALGKAA